MLGFIPRLIAITGFAMAAAGTTAVAQPMHKCVINGTVSYQQSPCPSTQRRQEPTLAELNAAEKSHRSAAPKATAPAPDTASSTFRCDGRQYCSQMRSCQEATYFLNNCPNVKMDGDRNGIPCEQQWCPR